MNDGQILYSYITDFLCQCVCVVIFIAVSKNLASTFEIDKIIDKIGVQLKGMKIQFLCSM